MLATNLDNTYISITTSLVTDMNYNPINEIPPESPCRGNAFFRDQTKPSLKNLVVDFIAGIIILTFSETVDITSLNISELTIVDCCNYSTNTDAMCKWVKK